MLEGWRQAKLCYRLKMIPSVQRFLSTSRLPWNMLPKESKINHF